MSAPEAPKTRSAQLAAREQKLRALLGPDTIKALKQNIATRVYLRMSKDNEGNDLSATDISAKLPETNAKVKDFQDTLDFDASRVMTGMHKVHLNVVKEQIAHEETLKEPRKELDEARRLGIPDPILEKAQQGFDETYDAPFVQAPLAERRTQAMEKARIAKETRLAKEKTSRESTPAPVTSTEKPADRVNHEAVARAAEILTGTRNATPGETIVLSKPTDAQIAEVPVTPAVVKAPEVNAPTPQKPAAERPAVTLSPATPVPVRFSPPTTPPAARVINPGVVRSAPPAEPERKVTRKFTKGDGEAAQMLAENTEIVTLKDLEAMIVTPGEQVSFGSLRERILDRLDTWVAAAANTRVAGNSKETQIAATLARKFGLGKLDFTSIRHELRGRFGVLLDTLHTHELTPQAQRGLHTFLSNPHDVTPDALKHAIQGDTATEVSDTQARETLLTAARNTVEQALAYHIVGVNPHPHLRWDDMAGVAVAGADAFDEVYQGVVRRVNLAFGIDPTAPNAPAGAAEFMSDEYIASLRKRLMTAAKPGDRWNLTVGETNPTTPQPSPLEERYAYLNNVKTLSDSSSNVYSITFSGEQIRAVNEKPVAQILQSLLLARDHGEGVDVSVLAIMLEVPEDRVRTFIRRGFKSIPRTAYIVDAETGERLTDKTRYIGIVEHNNPKRIVIGPQDKARELRPNEEVEIESSMAPLTPQEAEDHMLARLSTKFGDKKGVITLRDASNQLKLPEGQIQKALDLVHTSPRNKGSKTTPPNLWNYDPADIAVALLTQIHTTTYRGLGMVEQVEFKDNQMAKYEKSKREREANRTQRSS